MLTSPNKSASKINALRAAFPFTVPILTGFLFLGMAYGILMNASGFSFLYPMLMSMTIFAGSMEFVTITLLLGAFNPLHAFVLTLLINARHLFYGISMLDKYRNTGKLKPYLIFGMCDESFSINCTVHPPLGVDRAWFMFFVTILNQLYWVTGSTLGGLFGSFIPFNTEGLDFVMTALFIVIFVGKWLEKRTTEASTQRAATAATGATLATTASAARVASLAQSSESVANPADENQLTATREAPENQQIDSRQQAIPQKDKAFTFRNRLSGVIGILVSAVSLVIFGSDNFIIPAMIGIIASLLLLRKPLERGSFNREATK